MQQHTTIEPIERNPFRRILNRMSDGEHTPRKPSDIRRHLRLIARAEEWDLRQQKEANQ